MSLSERQNFDFYGLKKRQDFPSVPGVKTLAESAGLIAGWGTGILNATSHGPKIKKKKKKFTGLPWWLRGKESACQCRGHGFYPWSEKMAQATEP